MPPILVYLDSSDFSVLSDPRRETNELKEILSQLRAWLASEKIVCCFSGIHLSEMAPLEAGYADAAQRRADLLAELCGRNALISQDRLFANELKFASGIIELQPSVQALSGEWYPEGVGEISPIGQIEMGKQITEVIRELHLNRTDRRKAERKTLKGGKPRANVKTSIVANARSGSLEEILDKYPMRPEDARTLSRYLAGDATSEQASAAFQESLRDPRWMMQWFAQNHAKLTAFLDWTRAPSALMIKNLHEMSKHAAYIYSSDKKDGTSLAKDLFSSTKWGTYQNEMLVNVGNRMARELLGENTQPIAAGLLDSHCPGLSVGIRSLHSAWWTTVSESPRTAKLSDFPDALHAMYAPYVDIFRADSFMSPYIAKQASRFGTTVVPKLSHLPQAIHSLLSAQSASI